jgi:hypothetical protein
MVAITFKSSIALVIALAQVINPVMAERFRIEAPTQAQIDFWGGWGARGAVSVREWDTTMGDKNKFSFQQKDGTVAKVSARPSDSPALRDEELGTVHHRFGADDTVRDRKARQEAR